MKTLMLCLFLTPMTFATPQQDKMKACNEDAKGKTGDERKAFMKGCLSAKTEAPPVTSRQLRMKECNDQAKGMKGEERRGFMKSCLSSPEIQP